MAGRREKIGGSAFIMKLTERKKELKKMTETRLVRELDKKTAELNKLTTRRSFGKLKDHNKVKYLRREIARINTYLREGIIKKLT